MRNIPIFSLKEEVHFFYEELMSKIGEVLLSGQFINGNQVKQFEEKVADFLHVRHAVGVNSGTDALVIALRALNIQEGDEVITTPFTFFATAEAISIVGAQPVFVDIEEDTFTIDPDLLESAITEKTKAIIPVHLFGQCVNMEKIMDIARKYEIKVIEDSAQAFGAEWNGQLAGTMGNIGCFSFFPTKNLGTYGDGGLVVTNDDELAEKIRMLRNHGSKKRYVHEMLGYNSRLDEIHAAILQIKLPYIQQWNEQRIKIASLYSERLQVIAGITTPVDKYGKHVYHQYTIKVNESCRNQLRQKLLEFGIQTMLYYPVPLHKLPVYEHLSLQLPVSEKVSHRVISLPIYPFMKKEEVEYVCDVIQKLIMQKKPLH